MRDHVMYGRDEHDWSWCSPPWSDVGRGLAALAVVTTILCTSMLVKTPNHPMQAWELLNEPNRTGQSPKHAQWPVVASHETIQSSTNGTWVASPPTAGFNVAVSEYWGVHDEVLGAVLYTLSEIPEANIQLFRNGWRWGFEEISDSFYNGTVLPWDDLPTRLADESDADARLDLVILASCEYTLERQGQQLLDIWDKRRHKFRIGCLVHEAFNLMNIYNLMADLAERDALDIYVLSPHIFGAILQALGFEPGSTDLETWPFSNVDIDFIAPIFPLSSTSSPLVLHEKPRLSRAIIQGNIEAHRRDYAGVFRDLEQEIMFNPEIFGYSLNGDATELLPLVSSDDRFILTLLGQDHGDVVTPKLLRHVVERRSEAMYPDFYSTLRENDILVPAFADKAYHIDKASSSVSAGIICNVPFLASQEDMEAYDWLDDRVVIRRPEGVTEMQAVASLRRARPGAWQRSEVEFDEFRRERYDENRQVLRASIRRAGG